MNCANCGEKLKSQYCIPKKAPVCGLCRSELWNNLQKAGIDPGGWESKVKNWVGTMSAQQVAKQIMSVVEIKPRTGYIQQWHAPGSGKNSYVVSRSVLGWSCDCMSWTRNMPRQDCKHILRVKLEQFVSGPTSQEKKSTAPPKPEGGRRFR